MDEDKVNKATSTALMGVAKINENTKQLREHFIKFIKANSIIVFIVIGILFLSIISYRLTPKPRIYLVNRIISNHIKNHINISSLKKLYGEYMLDGEPGEKGLINIDKLYKPNDINKLNKKNITNYAQKKQQLYFTLCDFYIASSAKTYLLMNKYYDYCSYDSIKQTIYTGARFIELDIFRKGLNDNENYPVVTNGTEKGQWKLCLNDLCLQTCLENIRDTALNPELSENYNNPFILYLNFNINSKLDSEKIIKANKENQFYKYTDIHGDYIFYNKVAKIINTVFNDTSSKSGKPYLIEAKYNIHNESEHQDKHSPIQLENIYNFLNKIIIMSNISGGCSDLGQYINFVCPKDITLNDHLYSLRSYNNKEFESIYDIETVKKNNKNLITHVYDDSPNNSLKNYMPGKSFKEGCQLITMYYQKDDINMVDYLNKTWSVNAVYDQKEKKNDPAKINSHSFNNGGFILKPEYLRISLSELLENTIIDTK